MNRKWHFFFCLVYLFAGGLLINNSERFMKDQVILQPIRALKLIPGDTLIIHFPKKPTDRQLQDIQRQLTGELWGKPVDLKIIYGPFDLLSTNERTQDSGSNKPSDTGPCGP